MRTREMEGRIGEPRRRTQSPAEGASRTQDQAVLSVRDMDVHLAEGGLQVRGRWVLEDAQGNTLASGVTRFPHIGLWISEGLPRVHVPRPDFAAPDTGSMLVGAAHAQGRRPHEGAGDDAAHLHHQQERSPEKTDETEAPAAMLPRPLPQPHPRVPFRIPRAPAWRDVEGVDWSAAPAQLQERVREALLAHVRRHYTGERIAEAGKAALQAELSGLARVTRSRGRGTRAGRVRAVTSPSRETMRIPLLLEGDDDDDDDENAETGENHGGTGGGGGRAQPPSIPTPLVAPLPLSSFPLSRFERWTKWVALQRTLRHIRRADPWTARGHIGPQPSLQKKAERVAAAAAEEAARARGRGMATRAAGEEVEKDDATTSREQRRAAAEPLHAPSPLWLEVALLPRSEIRVAALAAMACGAVVLLAVVTLGFAFALLAVHDRAMGRK